MTAAPSLLATNESRGAILAARTEVAGAIFSRMKGLLGRDGLEPGEALHIVPCNSIHTFFMRFPIDVLFLGREGEVIRALDAVVPWRATRVYTAARSVLELPAGVLAMTGTRTGDLISFRPA